MRLFRRSILLAIINLILIVTNLKASYNWSIECVDCPLSGMGGLQDIAHKITDYDANNDVSYFLLSGDSLFLIKWGATNWEAIELVSENIENCELKVTNENDIHISYVNKNTHNLYYIHYNGTSWSEPQLVRNSINIVAHPISMAVSGNTVYIAYCKDNITYLSTGNNNYWVYEELINIRPNFFKLLTDSNNNRHFIYIYEDKIYDKINNNDPQIIYESYHQLNGLSARIDQTDNLRLLFIENVNISRVTYYNLVYYFKEGSSWQYRIVETSDNQITDAGKKFIINEEGEPEIIYVVDYKDLKLARLPKSTQKWEYQIIDTNVDWYSNELGIVKRSNGERVIGYRRNSSEYIINYEESGAWNPVQIFRDYLVGDECTICLDNEDRPTLLYFVADPLQSRYILRRARRLASGWEKEDIGISDNIEPSNTRLKCKYDREDKFLIFYYLEDTEKSFKMAHKEGTDWVVELIDSSTNPDHIIQSFSATIDNDNNIWFFYCFSASNFNNVSQFKYRKRTSTGWEPINEFFNNEIFSQINWRGLKIDDNNNPICSVSIYNEKSYFSVKYYYLNSNNWFFDEILASSFEIPPFLYKLSTGDPVIIADDMGYLKFYIKIYNTWTNYYNYELTRDTNLIEKSSDDTFHLIYQYQNGLMHLEIPFSPTATPTTELITTEYSFGMKDFTISSDDRLMVCYQDSNRYDLKFMEGVAVTPTPTTTSTPTPQISPTVTATNPTITNTPTPSIPTPSPTFTSTIRPTEVIYTSTPTITSTPELTRTPTVEPTKTPILPTETPTMTPTSITTLTPTPTYTPNEATSTPLPTTTNTPTPIPAPIIYAGGWMDTSLQEGVNGKITLSCLIYGESIKEVKLFYIEGTNKIDTGLRLQKEWQNGLFSIYTFKLENIDGSSLIGGKYLFGIQAENESGVKSDMWPYLKIEKRSYSKRALNYVDIKKALEKFKIEMESEYYEKKTENTVPMIMMGGYFDTVLVDSETEELMMVLWIEPKEQISEVELYYGGEPTGVKLWDSGVNGDFNAGDGLWTYYIFDIPSEDLPEGEYLIEAKARDVNGVESNLFPYLEIKSAPTATPTPSPTPTRLPTNTPTPTPTGMPTNTPTPTPTNTPLPGKFRYDGEYYHEYEFVRPGDCSDYEFIGKAWNVGLGNLKLRFRVEYDDPNYPDTFFVNYGDEVEVPPGEYVNIEVQYCQDSQYFVDYGYLHIEVEEGEGDPVMVVLHVKY